MKRGEIWLGRLNPARGAEIGKTRPVLIVQDNALTASGSRTVIVLPLTTQVSPEREPGHVTLSARGSLHAPSQVMTDSPRTLDRERLLKGPLARVSAKEMAAVEKGLLAALGMYR
jgi:mRNA interferase MazF